MLGLVGIHALIFNHEGDTCSQYINAEKYVCRGGFAILYSMGNRGAQDSFKLPSMLNLIFVILGLWLALIYRRNQTLMAERIDKDTVTASDYTVMVHSLPKESTVDKIKELFSKSNEGKDIITVKKVSMAYKVSHIISLYRKKERLEKKKNSLFEYKLKKINRDIELLEENEIKMSEYIKKHFEQRRENLGTNDNTLLHKIREKFQKENQEAKIQDLTQKYMLLKDQEEKKLGKYTEKFKREQEILENKRSSLYEIIKDFSPDDREANTESKIPKNFLLKKDQVKLNKIEKEIREDLKELNENPVKRFSGIAFVTFDTEKRKNFIAR